MSEANAPFTTSLRAGGDPIVIAPGVEPRIAFRVQLLDLWDAVAVEAPLAEPLLGVKVTALQALDSTADFHDDYVVKLRGIAIFDENRSLEECGVSNGSILSVAHRRRRPVR